MKWEYEICPKGLDQMQDGHQKFRYKVAGALTGQINMVHAVLIWEAWQRPQTEEGIRASKHLAVILRHQARFKKV